MNSTVEEFVKPDGFGADRVEAYRKLINYQFGNDPYRGFSELIQNAIDSYESEVPLDQRSIELIATETSLSVKDEGTGLSLEKVKLLLTLGGTDKPGDSEKIGRFGVGFFASLNPVLTTTRVEVQTILDGERVKVTVIVNKDDPWQLPQLQAEVLDKGSMTRGTEVTVHFHNPASVGRCLSSARNYVEYLPCPVLLNGSRLAASVWEAAKGTDALEFKDRGCHGFVRLEGNSDTVSILCHYIRIISAPLSYIASASRRMNGDLRDYDGRFSCFLPSTRSVVNDNALTVTLGRNSVLRNWEYENMLRALADAHLLLLGRHLQGNRDPHLIAANQFLLRVEITALLSDPAAAKDEPRTAVLLQLADAGIYTLENEKHAVSLREIYNRRSQGKPVFYSPSRTNTDWLAHGYDHDFIVLPPPCRYFGISNHYFYDELFAKLFGDVVNLDTIQDQPERVQELVKRGIVDPRLLDPECRMVGAWEATIEEKEFVAEINRVLAFPEVGRAIRDHLHLTARHFEATLFELEGASEYKVATGLFDDDGRALLGQFEGEQAAPPQRKLRLGLLRSHPLIQHLIRAKDKCRALYAITILAHQLARCQQLLVPHYSFRHWVTNALARDLRSLLAQRLLTQGASPAPTEEAASG